MLRIEHTAGSPNFGDFEYKPDVSWNGNRGHVISLILLGVAWCWWELLGSAWCFLMLLAGAGLLL